MSGVGEAIAIVSCVAGLIQAYDAGTRVVKQIKARRVAHGALPPSQLLEESIEKGKKEIQDVVAEGNKRFGVGFEAGDTTAQLALLQITVQTQNALLERLTIARDDDGVIDFDECVDFSDKGRNDAILALRLLFQRKLEEEMNKKRMNPPPRYDAPLVEVATAQPTTPQPVVEVTPPERPPPVTSTSAPVQMQTSPAQDRKKSTGFSKIFRRTSTAHTQQLPTPSSTPEPVRPIPSPSKSKSQSVSVASPTRLPSRPKPEHRPSMSSENSWSSGRPGSSLNTPIDTQSTNWEPSMSRQSTSVSTISTNNAVITKYGGCCKYAFFIRESGFSKGLMLENTMHFGEAMVYSCQSTKCNFQRAALKPGKSYQPDDKVYESHEIQFRWMFLAKSHVQAQAKTSEFPFTCLLCTMLYGRSATYAGNNELFSHIKDHREQKLGDVVLEGPLSFTNSGIRRDPDNFDLYLPEFESEPQTPTSGHGVPSIVDQRLREELEKFTASAKPASLSSNTMEVRPSENDPWDNPW